MAWAPDKVVGLKALWEASFSPEDIATLLGGFENHRRNGLGAVLAKAHALKLPKRKNNQHLGSGIVRPKVQAHRPAATQYGRQYPTTEVTLQPADELFVPPKIRRSIMQLTDDTCKFPYGTPGKEDFYFCGLKPEEGPSPYCGYHSRLAYQITPGSRRYKIASA